MAQFRAGAVGVGERAISRRRPGGDRRGDGAGKRLLDRPTEIEGRLKALRDYLKKNDASQNLHNRVWMLWASAKMDGLLTREQKDKLIAQILAKQQAGRRLEPGLAGRLCRKDVKDQSQDIRRLCHGVDPARVQVAGVREGKSAGEQGPCLAAVESGSDGAWRAASVNKNRAPESTDPGKANIGKFMWDAATAYSVLALSH